ncbi:TPA: hypothetical protein ACM384_003215 [Escherichia coli]
MQREIGQRRDKVFSEQYSYGADTVRDGVSFSKVEEDRYWSGMMQNAGRLSVTPLTG